MEAFKSNTAVATPQTTTLDRSMLAVTISLLIEIVGIVGFFGAGTQTPPAMDAAMAFLGVSILGGLLYLVFLGGLAGRLGKSRITWVGLTVLTNPIGGIVAYFMIRAAYNAEITRIKYPLYAGGRK